MSDVLISVENVSKKFCKSLKRSMLYGIQDITKNVFGISSNTDGLKPTEFWAVDNVSFEVHRGECLGIIGPNGSGKSTILKILNGIISPDKGKVTIKGRVGALIEVGAGFHPLLTGRENIYVNGAILGFSKKEIGNKFDEIVAFAELEEFIDTPVKYYSSGMYVRLGFAIAAQMEPDILLIDEILAVGDVGFRSKCYNVISSLTKKCAIIFISHSMPMVARISQRSLVMNKGINHFYGKTNEAVIKYYNLFESNKNHDRMGSGEVQINAMHFGILDNNCRGIVRYGDELSIRVKITANIDIADLILNVVFRDLLDNVIAECNNYINPVEININKNESIEIEISIKEFTLNTGIYNVDIILMSENMIRHYDWIRPAKVIEVLGPRVATGGQQFRAIWSFL